MALVPLKGDFPDPKGRLTRFCERYCQRTIRDGEIEYLTYELGEQHQCIVVLQCMKGNAFPGCIRSNQRDAEWSAAEQALKAFASLTEMMLLPDVKEALTLRHHVKLQAVPAVGAHKQVAKVPSSVAQITEGDNEKSETVEGDDVARKPYFHIIDELIQNTVLCEHDFDDGIQHMLNALWECGKLHEACDYVKEVVEFHSRNKVSNWKGYLTKLLRSFYQKAVNEAKAADQAAATAAAASAPKFRLNSLIGKTIRRVSQRSLAKGDICYSVVESKNGFQASVCFEKNRWSGEVCETEKEAEHSAAAVAVETFRQEAFRSKSKLSFLLCEDFSGTCAKGALCQWFHQQDSVEAPSVAALELTWLEPEEPETRAASDASKGEEFEPSEHSEASDGGVPEAREADEAKATADAADEEKSKDSKDPNDSQATREGRLPPWKAPAEQNRSINTAEGAQQTPSDASDAKARVPPWLTRFRKTAASAAPVEAPPSAVAPDVPAAVPAAVPAVRTPREWTVPEVVEWLKLQENGAFATSLACNGMWFGYGHGVSPHFARYAELFQSRQVDGLALSKLTAGALKELGMQALGPRKVLAKAIEALF